MIYNMGSYQSIIEEAAGYCEELLKDAIELNEKFMVPHQATWKEIWDYIDIRLGNIKLLKFQVERLTMDSFADDRNQIWQAIIDEIGRCITLLKGLGAKVYLHGNKPVCTNLILDDMVQYRHMLETLQTHFDSIWKRFKFGTRY
jgi:hypothetical protein